MELFLWGLGIFLAAVGLVELLRLGVFWLCRPQRPAGLWLAVAPRDGEECEHLVRAAAERVQWLGWRGPCTLLCVNGEGDPHIEAVCKILERRYPFLRLCKREDLVYDIGEQKT